MEDHTLHDVEAKKSIQEIVKKHGWYVGMFRATTYLPSFAYTIGLWKTFEHPEIISFGLKPETLGAILNTAGDKVKTGQKIALLTDYDDFFENGPAQFLKVDERNLKDYFGYGLWYNEHKAFPALQLVWTDRKHVYPWDRNFEEEFLFRQPLLDRNADFKFREDENLGIFTNRQYVEDKKPILYVMHDADGDWQFLTGDTVEDSDARLVCLKHMVAQDRTLNEVFNLDYGERAERDFVGGEWTRSKKEN